MDDVIVIILITTLLLIVATGIIVLVLVYQKKQLQYLSEKDLLKASFEKEILESKLEIQEQTMKHISQEIHDNIGQVLSVVKLNVTLMNCDDPKHRLQEKIADASALVGKVIQDLRDLSKSLDKDYITSKGLVKAIQYEFDVLKKTGAYTTALHIEHEPYDLPDHSELILFRIFQEVINNIIKHANATVIQVCILFEPKKFSLHIQDNGQGFDISTMISADNSSGLGVRNIINRTQMIGAACSIDSQPGNGTLVLIALAMPEPVML